MTVRHHRRFVALALAGAACMLLSGPLSAQRARPNIDSLTAQEMQVLQNALRAIKALPPTNHNSYVFLQEIHNGLNGPCEHGSEAFLPWHRMLMRRFELALQQSGVPGAENIMLPYWDWSQPPSGRRYPRTCEDPNSEFFHPGRNPPGSSSLPTAEVAGAMSAQTWLQFGGDRPGAQGPSIGDEPPPGPGWLERPPHNFMHANYIGGVMGPIHTAARDPLFWLFHTGIDRFWWQWQQEHPHAQPQVPSHPLRGFLNTTIHDAWNAEALGYTYQRRIPLHEGCSFGESEENQPLESYHFDFTVPRAGFKRAELQISEVKMEGAHSYTVYYYIHPIHVAYSADTDFQEKYRAGLDAHFGGAPGDGHAHGHQPAKAHIRVDVTGTMTRLATSHAGEHWRITAVYEGLRDAATGLPAPVLVGRDIDQGTIHLVLE